MILLDVNVLVSAFRADAPHHRQYRAWLDERLLSPMAFGIADLALSGFLRVATHPRVFNPPSELTLALNFAAALKAAPNFVPVAPGPRHWELFLSLCRSSNARGNLVPDAYFAALAIESGNEWITADRGFARFAGLRWRHPLD